MITEPQRPTGLAHIAIAVKDAETTATRYAELLGASVRSRETLADRGLLALLLDVAGVPIELLQPLDPSDEKNTVARFLQRRGEGLHHVAFLVPNASAALDCARLRGAEVLDEAPRPGAHGTMVGFLHPRSTAGALIEVVQAAAPQD